MLGLSLVGTSENISSSSAYTSSRQDSRRQHENPAAKGEALSSRGGMVTIFHLIMAGSLVGKQEQAK